MRGCDRLFRMKQKRATTKPNRFKRITISMPVELLPYVEQRTAEPQHSWSVSSYIRGLIIRDKSSSDQTHTA